MTPEQFLNEHPTISHFYSDKEERMICYSSDVEKAMLEFANYHVKRALEEAMENIPYGGTDPVYYEDIAHISDCYRVNETTISQTIVNNGTVSSQTNIKNHTGDIML